MRIALQDAPVHERSGVAFVGVADDVLRRTVGLGDRVPLQTGRETGAAAAAQAAPGDLLSYFGRRHRGERRTECIESAVGEMVVEAFRIDAPGVLGHDAELPAEERRLRHTDAARRRVDQCLDDPAEVIGPNMREQLTSLRDLHQRACRTEAQATNPLDREHQ